VHLHTSMPWLVQEAHASSALDALLFIHVPRCGGTSLTKHYNVLSRATAGPNLFKKFTLHYFGYRYRVLETSNFPWKTYENMYVIFILIIATALLILTITGHTRGAPFYVLFSHALVVFMCSTFMFTAPALRSNFFRRFWLILLRMICAESPNWLYGANTKGLLIHLTAPRMLHTRLVSREEMGRVSSFAIVRNPFSRMVSVYMYNRLGPAETFAGFVCRWEKAFKAVYEKRASNNRTDPINEWDVYCHVLPMHEFTHSADGEQLVQYVIKQEELKSLQSSNPGDSVRDISPALRDALLSMPHSNFRKRDKPWKDYYDPETERIVREMYRMDFEMFGYDTSLDASAAKAGNTSSDPPSGGWPVPQGGGAWMEDAANSFKQMTANFAVNGGMSMRTMPPMPVPLDKSTSTAVTGNGSTPGNASPTGDISPGQSSSANDLPHLAAMPAPMSTVVSIPTVPSDASFSSALTRDGVSGRGSPLPPLSI